jgi:hypothetical protein
MMPNAHTIHAWNSFKNIKPWFCAMDHCAEISVQISHWIWSLNLNGPWDMKQERLRWGLWEKKPEVKNLVGLLLQGKVIRNRSGWVSRDLCWVWIISIFSFLWGPFKRAIYLLWIRNTTYNTYCTSVLRP